VSDGIYVALSGAIAQTRNLETTAANLANANTDGYQRVRPVFREELARAGSAAPGSHYASLDGTSLDTTRGGLRPTGNPLDFAMPEGTYLAVSTARGDRYTRAASLKVGTDSVLRTARGDAVLGEDGKNIKVAGGANAVRIDDSGQVWQGEDVSGRVKLVSFAQPSNLSHDEGAVLQATPAAGAITPSRGPVQVGQIEESNANVVGAMTDLVTATRTFEAFQRVIDAFRDADHKVVTTVPDAGQ
jgi:flagellar basal-body rod protein FlgF